MPISMAVAGCNYMAMACEQNASMVMPPAFSIRALSLALCAASLPDVLSEKCTFCRVTRSMSKPGRTEPQLLMAVML